MGDKGYVGTGGDGAMEHNDFWTYDPSSNTWTQRADFGGDPREAASAFSIGDKGYIGGGSDFNSHKVDFWEYNSLSDFWTKKSDYPGATDYGAVGFSIGSVGYICTGAKNIVGPVKDVYQYIPDCDTLTVYADVDGDTYGDASNSTIICDSILPTGYVYDNTDCNDANPSINPAQQKFAAMA
ncbi:MAG: hypothetical protein LH473_01330 [Chitinophagales bacterium]|nr:hypothetical protein [Chitinophagales bacterium]